MVKVVHSIAFISLPTAMILYICDDDDNDDYDQGSLRGPILCPQTVMDDGMKV